MLHTNLIREDGFATYPGLRRGTYTLVAKDADGYGLRTFRVRGLRSYDLGQLRLTKPLLTLRGRTAPRAVVEATTSDLCPADASPTLGGFHEIEKADAQGRYVIRGLVPGDAWMVAADGFPHNYAPVCHDDVKIWSSRHYDVPLAAGHSATGRLVYEGTDLPVITNIGYEVLYPAGLKTNPTDEHPTRARTRGATGEFTITRLSEGTATGGLAVTPSDEVFARSLWVFFPYQYGTPYWLEADQEPLTIDGDIDLGDVGCPCETGRWSERPLTAPDCRRCRAGSSRDEPARRGHAAPPPMLTIQLMPKRSVSWPNSSPHTCFSSGTATAAPSESASQ